MRRLINPLAGIGMAVCCVAPLCAKAAPAPVNTTAAVRAYARVLHKINPQMPDWQSHDLAKHMLINAGRWKIDANLLVALVTVESSWHTRAVSNVGALGLGQLMPGTAQLLRVNPHDPYQNLQGAARYLHGLLTRFKGTPNRYALAFAAYNAGPKAVERYGGVPPFYETQRYVVKVMTTWQLLSRIVHVPRLKVPARMPALAVVNAAPDVNYWAGSQR